MPASHQFVLGSQFVPSSFDELFELEFADLLLVEAMFDEVLLAVVGDSTIIHLIATQSTQGSNKQLQHKVNE